MADENQEQNLETMAFDEYARQREAEDRGEPAADDTTAESTETPAKSKANPEQPAPSTDDSADQSDDSEDFSKYVKRFDRVNRRFERETAKRKELEKKLAELEQQQQKSEPAAEGEPAKQEEAVPTERPKFEDYPNSKEFVAALERYMDANYPEDDVPEGKPEPEPEDKVEIQSHPKADAPKTDWDDLLEILDESEDAPDEMRGDLIAGMKKGDIRMTDEMISWLVSNEESAVTVVQRFIDHARTSRQISNMAVSKARTRMKEIASGTDAPRTVRSPTTISDVRQTGIDTTEDLNEMSYTEYERLRWQEDNPGVQ